MDLFCQDGCASNRSCATAAKKPNFLNTSPHNSHSQLEDVPANGIIDFHRCRSIVQLPGIARIAKMFEYVFAEHRCKYGKARAAPATHVGQAFLFTLSFEGPVLRMFISSLANTSSQSKQSPRSSDP